MEGAGFGSRAMRVGAAGEAGFPAFGRWGSQSAFCKAKSQATTRPARAMIAVGRRSQGAPATGQLTELGRPQCGQ